MKSPGKVARILGNPVTGAVCRLLLGAIFIHASVPKLFRPDLFARFVYGYRFLHPDLVNLVGITLPWIELLAGSLLLLGLLPRSSAVVIAGLMGLFITAGALALARGLEISCGCFFPFMTDRMLSWDLLIRDIILVLLALQIIVWPSSFVLRRKN